MPSFTSVSKGVIYFLINYYNKSKECLKFVKILPDPLPQFMFQDNTIRTEKDRSYQKDPERPTRIERSYQTHCHNLHSKISGLVARFSGRRNCPQAGYTVAI